MHIPEIVTKRLLLRPIRLTDAADLYEYAQDEWVARPGMWEPYASFGDCERQVADLVDRYDSGLMWWALEHRENRRVIGRVQLSNWDRTDSHAELSYALARSYWRQGLMTEAVEVATEYAWRILALHRLSATVRPDNLGSIRILQKIGMQQEGRLRDYRRLWDEWVDVDMYAVFKSPPAVNVSELEQE